MGLQMDNVDASDPLGRIVVRLGPVDIASGAASGTIQALGAVPIEGVLRDIRFVGTPDGAGVDCDVWDEDMGSPAALHADATLSASAVVAATLSTDRRRYDAFRRFSLRSVATGAATDVSAYLVFESALAAGRSSDDVGPHQQA